MSCDRCSDIHLAQREGKTLSRCECGCHIQPKYDDYTLGCTCGWGTTTLCPIHGYSTIWTACDCSTDGTIDVTTSIPYKP